MMRWRLAQPAIELGDQVDAAAPTRSKVSDGTIGDAAHSSRSSDHNVRDGVVRARDITHDPGRWDAHAHARRVAAAVLPCVKYIISAGEIWTPSRAKLPKLGRRGWTKYRGANRHDKHAHFSIKNGHENTRGVDWQTGTPAPAPQTPPPVAAPTPPMEQDAIVIIRELHFIAPRPPEVWLFDGLARMPIPTPTHRDALTRRGIPYEVVTNVIEAKSLLDLSREI